MKPVSSARRSAENLGPEATALTLSNFLPYRLNVLAAVVSDGLARTYGARFGIGIPEWRALATIGEFSSITAKAIGIHAHMGKVKVSRAASALEARDLIRRLPNPDDLREAFLVLTPAGDGMYSQIAVLALAYVSDLEADLSPDDEAALDRLIKTLQRRALAMASSAGGRDQT